MTLQQEITSFSGEIEDSEVSMSPLFLCKLVEANQTVPSGVSVMLILASGVDAKGMVQVSQERIAGLCNINIKKLREAILGLVDAGLITSVEISPEPAGDITCYVSREFVRYHEQQVSSATLSGSQVTA